MNTYVSMQRWYEPNVIVVTHDVSIGNQPPLKSSMGPYTFEPSNPLVQIKGTSMSGYPWSFPKDRGSRTLLLDGSGTWQLRHAYDSGFGTRRDEEGGWVGVVFGLGSVRSGDVCLGNQW